MSSVLLHGKTLALAGNGSIGVNLQIRPRDFATQIVITLTSQNQLDISGAVSTQVSFVESFCIYCFPLLFIIHSFYFSKESVHDSGKQRRVGCDQ